MTRFLLIAAALTIASAFSVAAAQTHPQWPQCRAGETAPSAQIAACTAIIESGAESGGLLAYALFLRGTAFYNARDFARSVADYDRALELSPGNAQVLDGRCWVRAEWGERLDLALADCNEALRLRPNRMSALDTRGYVNLRLGQNQAAWSDYDAALSLSPGEAHSMYGRGVAALRLGRTAEGRADIEHAQQITPDIAQTYAGYGITP